MSGAVISRSVRSSELSRNPAAVFKAAEEGPVTITRRDGESLILTKSSEARRQHAGLELAAHLVAASLAPDDKPFEERLRLPFPWMEFLTADDRSAFAKEIVDVARACAAVSQFDRLLVAINAWQSTAEALAAGYTRDEDLDWLDEPVHAPDPRTE